MSLIGLAPASGANLPPDIVILCEPTLRPMLSALDTLWRRRNTGSLRLFSASTAGGLKLAGNGARADMIFGKDERLGEEAVAAGIIKSDDLIGAWRDPLVLAADRTQPHKDQAASLSATIDGARVATIVDSLPPAAIDDLGLANAGLKRHVSAADSDDAVALLKDRTVAYAIIFASDLKAQPHLAALAPLPEQLAPPVTVWAGESRQSRSVEVAHFIEFLKSDEVQSLLAAYGLEKVAP